MAFLSREELDLMGFAHIGDYVSISDKASIYNPSKISIGSYVRIDDFALLSAGEGGIEIGNFVHISCYATLLGHAKITLHDFVAISIKATILSSTGDYSGEFVPSISGTTDLKEFGKGLTNVISNPVIFETHSGLGAHSLVLPGVKVGIGSGIGGMSLVHCDIAPWGIYMGNPARFITKRSDHAYKEMEKIRKAEESTTDEHSE